MTRNTDLKKHVPLRMCVVCRRESPKSDLIRMVKSDKGKIILDEKNRLPGKGIYICKNRGCICDFMGNKRYSRQYRKDFAPELADFLANIVRNVSDPECAGQGRE